jgi:tetratricopeptide (TPR) repeat protein
MSELNSSGIRMLKTMVVLHILIVAHQGALSANQAESEQAEVARSLVPGADSLYSEREWENAATLYEQIVELNPADGGSMYRLSICYHTAGDLPKAIRAHELASQYPENRVNSLYNLACAYALTGDKPRAFEALQLAVDAGFSNNQLALQDSDLDALRDDPQFEEFLRQLLGEGYTSFDGSYPTPQQMRKGISILTTTLRKEHPNPYRHFSPEEWDLLEAAALARVDSLSEVGYYVEVRELAGMVGDVHTSAYPKRGSRIMKRGYGFRLWNFADGLYLRAVAPDLVHLLGARVLAIQGVPVEQAWQTVMNKMSTENEWMSTYMSQVHMQFPDYLHALGLSESDSSGQWTFLMPGGERQSFELVAKDSSGYLGALGTSIGIKAPVGWIQGHNALAQIPRWLKNQSENYWYEYIEGTDAVFMQVNLPRRHGRPWRSFLEEMFEYIRKNDEVERLVIDLRHNEGGWGYMAHALVHGIVATPKINRPGHLYVLTSRITQSAGVTIATKLDIETHSIFVGEPCGAHPNFYNGPMGNHPPLALPGTDIVFRVSTELEQNSDPLDNRCFIACDLPAAMSHDDYITGRDPALEAALTLSPSEGNHFFTDPGGRELQVYFHWRRPSQREAFQD